MPAPKLVRTPAIDEWDDLQLRLTWPEQYDYEVIRPVVLFGLSAAERAEQTGLAQRATPPLPPYRAHGEPPAVLSGEMPPVSLQQRIARWLRQYHQIAVEHLPHRNVLTATKRIS